MSSKFSYFDNIVESFNQELSSYKTDKLIELIIENPFIKNSLELLLILISIDNPQYRIINQIINHPDHSKVANLIIIVWKTETE